MGSRIRKRETVGSCVRSFSLNQQSSCIFFNFEQLLILKIQQHHLLFIIAILRISPHISITLLYDHHHDIIILHIVEQLLVVVVDVDYVERETQLPLFTLLERENIIKCIVIVVVVVNYNYLNLSFVSHFSSIPKIEIYHYSFFFPQTLVLERESPISNPNLIDLLAAFEEVDLDCICVSMYL